MSTGRTARRTVIAVATTGGLLATGLLTGPGAGAAVGVFTQTGSITINDNTTATPYPSTIAVAGALNGITDVNVTLSSFDHTIPDDVDVLLVGPAGQQAVLMSDVGGAPDAVDLSLVIDDEAAAALADAGPLTSGTFQPTNIGAGDPFAAPAPVATSANSVLGVFDETNPNGTWSLFVVDDVGGAVGDFSGGWSLQITTVDAPAAPVISAPVTNSTDNDGNFILTGSAPAGTTVNVFEGTTSKGSAAATSGSWAVALVGVLDGSHTYTATATNSLGNVSAASAGVLVRVDTVDPKVLRTRPVDGADTVRRGASIRASFSEAMRSGTINRANVRLVKVGTTRAIRAVVTYGPITRKVKINPIRQLAGDTEYKAIVSTRVRDLAGNRLDQKAAAGNQRLVWRFVTR